jgi:hypothetical protein
MNGGVLLFVSAIIFMTNQHNLETRPAAILAHVSNSFQFVVQAPLNRAAPLFGPEGERCWAGQHWNPEFLYPQPGKDVQGAVFTVQHGPHKSVWVNTLFDPERGRMQYVSFVPGALVSTVDVRLRVLDPLSTSVEVTYARTALDAAANDDVQGMGKLDRESGPEWRHAIEKCLTTELGGGQNR